MSTGNQGGHDRRAGSATSTGHPEISKLNNHSVVAPRQALRKQIPAKWYEHSTHVRSVRNLGRPGRSSKPDTVYDISASGGKKNNSLQGLADMATRANGSKKHPTVFRSHDWSQWVELGIQYSGFPDDATTKDVWNVFKEEGEVLTIELFDDFQGNTNGKGRVRFRSVLSGR